ncbi:uncharacterized protein QC764_0113580 [Podospora pseudoanserina]|uniref:Uncharacterized protein n=1 Tax=Podospora pseudoanserina TaxID=2609844 RepID=A0ABR0HJJ8_9PEZI|nr:hypothetical protein QC764_0113580 [Podospora pseudoanserina]
MRLQFESVVAIRVHPGCLFNNNPANSAITCGFSVIARTLRTLRFQLRPGRRSLLPAITDCHRGCCRREK